MSYTTTFDASHKVSGGTSHMAAARSSSPGTSILGWPR